MARGLPHNADLPDRDLAVFLAGTPEMEAYRRDLFWAQEYARRNRAVMLALLCGVVRERFRTVGFDEPISCHHNYVAEETYGGVDLLVTRKGAIRAGSGELGIIPGSMGTGSYIVRGLGNADAFCSARTAPAGAWPRARREADRSRPRTSPSRPTASSAARTPVWSTRSRRRTRTSTEVMADQDDLVEVVAQLKQVVCVKG